MTHLLEKYTRHLDFLEKDANPTDTLYHYTTWSGLNGILKTRQLWLTHYLQLNDTSEILHALETIRKFIFEIIPNHNMSSIHAT